MSDTRLSSSAGPDREYEALRRTAGFADLSDRSQVLVSGGDAASFLQSLVSQDVALLADGKGAASLLLEPRGKLGVAFRVLRVTQDEWWLDTDPGCGDALAGGLRRFRVRVNVEVVGRGASFAMLRALGPESGERVADMLGVEVPQPEHAHVSLPGRDGCRLVSAGWPGVRGVDVIGPAGPVAEVMGALRETVQPVGRDVIEVMRIESGVPLYGRELDETVIPQEAFLDRDAVSFDKGCFLGQELVCRINSRGHVNRYLRGLVIRSDDLPSPGSEVRVGGDEVGHLTSVARSPRLGVVGLAFVRREVEPPSVAAVVTAAGAVPAEIVKLPFAV